MAVSPDIDSYLDFVLSMFLAFGLAFEVPIATVMLLWSGLVSIKTLTGAATVHTSRLRSSSECSLRRRTCSRMTLLAVPMYLLYEVGLVMARIMLPEKTRIVEKEVGT